MFHVTKKGIMSEKDENKVKSLTLYKNYGMASHHFTKLDFWIILQIRSSDQY